MEYVPENMVDSYANIKIRICNTHKKIDRLIKYIKKTGHCSFDFETNAVPVDQDNFIPTIVGISFQPGARYVVPLAHFESPFRDDDEWMYVLMILDQEIFSNPKITKYAHNGKFELHILRKYGFNVLGKFFDSMLAKHLLDENTNNGLKDVICRLLPQWANYDNELVIIKKEYGNDWNNIPLKPLSIYCSLDCDLTLRLHQLLERRLFNLPKLYSLYRNLCMMNTRVLAESELLGMDVDLPYLRRIEKKERRAIERNHEKVMSHKVVKRFDRWRFANHIQKLIDKITEDIEQIKATEDIRDGKVRNKIAHRERKLSEYIAGELVTKADKFDRLNLNSTPQLVEFLYTSPEGLNLPILAYTKHKVTKRETENPSTSEETLLQLVDKDKTGFIKRLLDHRSRTKLHSTYMVGILDRSNHRTSKVHARFLIHGTVTGRLSCREPNLQNIPRDTTAGHIKKMFVPPKGYLWIEMDYSQAELRYLAEVSGDKDMIDIFTRGYNIHLATGLKINGYTLDEYYDIANDARKSKDNPDYEKWTKVHKSGKVTNFSIIYQQGDFATAASLGVSVKKAEKFKAEWYEQFPNIKKFLKEIEDNTFKNGYVENAFGRRRRLANIKLRNKQDRRSKGKYAKAVRDAINAPIQGGSSDYAQSAAIEIWESKMRGLEPFNYSPYQIYTVHDSLGYFCRPEHIHKFISAIKKVGEKPKIKDYFGFELKHVSMNVSIEVGTNWATKEEYNPFKNYKKLLEENEDQRITKSA